MKGRHYILLVISLILCACGEDNTVVEASATPEVAKDSISTIEGDFIFLSNAAVLKGENFIYGVQIDSVSKKLAERIAPLKKDEFHMIPVVVKGKIISNPRRDGWEEIVQIRELIEISASVPDSLVPHVTKELDKP